MGGAIAQRIIAAGWKTVLWARRPEALEAFDASNVETAATPTALAAEVDLVGICVWADDDVRDVVAGEHGVLAGCREGTVVVIHSTVAPATCRELAAVAIERGVTVVDAPVSGGRDVALAGELTVVAGGEEAALARCRPVFDSFAGSVVRVGAVGAGQVAKLLNNALFSANLAVAGDALSLGETLGLDPAVLAEFLGVASGRSYALDVALMTRASAEARQAAAPALEKDLQTLRAEFAALGDTAPVLDAAAEAAIRRLGD
jgi:3-hydroxyisobutyrate dehydrogenase-like beta-hydroxyacid dehydrogenase